MIATRTNMKAASPRGECFRHLIGGCVSLTCDKSVRRRLCQREGYSATRSAVHQPYAAGNVVRPPTNVLTFPRMVRGSTPAGEHVGKRSRRVRASESAREQTRLDPAHRQL